MLLWLKHLVFLFANCHLRSIGVTSGEGTFTSTAAQKPKPKPTFFLYSTETLIAFRLLVRLPVDNRIDSVQIGHTSPNDEVRTNYILMAPSRPMWDFGFPLFFSLPAGVVAVCIVPASSVLFVSRHSIVQLSCPWRPAILAVAVAYMHICMIAVTVRCTRPYF